MHFSVKFRIGCKHGADLNSTDMRAYLKQWVKSQERDGLALRTPSRAYSYIHAFAALLLGYHHLHVLDDVRMKRKQVFTSSLEQSLAPKKEKAYATKD